MEEAECLACGLDTFQGQFDGYEFIWYCMGCGREFDGQTNESIAAMGAEVKEEYLKEGS